MKTDFHNKDFALSLTLKWRLRRSRKWPINSMLSQFKSPGLRFFVYCICIIMWHSHLNDMEIPETKRFIRNGFELAPLTVEFAESVYPHNRELLDV